MFSKRLTPVENRQICFERILLVTHRPWTCVVEVSGSNINNVKIAIGKSKSKSTLASRSSCRFFFVLPLVPLFRATNGEQRVQTQRHRQKGSWINSKQYTFNVRRQTIDPTPATSFCCRRFRWCYRCQCAGGERKGKPNLFTAAAPAAESTNPKAITKKIEGFEYGVRKWLVIVRDAFTFVR